jgi:condensin complex subunit 1
VRRYAIALLTKLILTHPYGVIHGGHLNVHEWEARYHEVRAELTSLEQRPVDEGALVEEEEEDEGEEEEGEEDESAILKDPGVTVDEDEEIEMNTVDGTAPSQRTRTSKSSRRGKKNK